MSAQGLTLYLRLSDGTVAEARALDPASAERLRKAAADAGPAGKSVRIRIGPEADTAGHAAPADTIGVSLEGDDVEGHTLILRLPSVAEAKAVQKRLLITGVVAASLIAGAAGMELAGQRATTQPLTGPASGPAITAPATRSNETTPVLRYQSQPRALDRVDGDSSAAAQTTGAGAQATGSGDEQTERVPLSKPARR